MGCCLVRRPRELGWIEGRSVAIDYRWAEEKEERFDEIAAEFAPLNDYLLSPTRIQSMATRPMPVS